MKYLRLYEAFESQILSKTLGYIKKDKGKFLKRLKNLCEDINFPLSQLNDNFFEYLPFKKALDKNISISDIPCDAKSSVFGENEVPGEVCKEGKLKRKWGNGTRFVTCPVCNGSGAKPQKSEVKLIKFWFDVDGNFLCTSAVDGIVRKTDSISLDDYELKEVKRFSNSSDLISEVKTGDYIKVKIGNKRESKIAYVYKGRHGSSNAIYCLTNDKYCEGSEPDGYEWKNIDTIFGKPKYSWVITGRSDYEGDPILLQVDMKNTEKEDTYNPYEHNVYFSGYSSIDPNTNLESSISKASFALILDLGKLKSSEYKSTKVTRSERGERKEGAFLSADDIKKANISRYLEKLTDVDVKEISNFKLLLKRVFGMNKNNYFYILSEYSTNILSTLSDMESRYKNIVVSLSNDEVEDANYQAKRLIRDTKNSISNNIEKSNYISINLRKLRNEVTDEQKAVLDKIDEVNKELVNQIEKFNFEYVEDFEIFYNKLKFFREVVRETHLGGYSFRNFLNRLTEESYSTMKDYFDNIDVDDVLKGLDSVSRILKRY